MACHTVLEGKFDFVDHDEGHRPLLQYDEWTPRSESVGNDLFALSGIDHLVELIDMRACARQQKGKRHACAVVVRAHIHTARNR